MKPGSVHSFPRRHVATTRRFWELNGWLIGFVIAEASRIEDELGLFLTPILILILILILIESSFS